MLLEGSCCCGLVSFTVHSAHVHPYNLCYCSICRKTAGAGGYAINLSGEHQTLRIQGQENISVYQAQITNEETGEKTKSHLQRSFCTICGSNLWAWSPKWPELVHPFASIIDSSLPIPPERTHLMTSSKAEWVVLRTDPQDQVFEQYPKESIAEWHKRLGLEN